MQAKDIVDRLMLEETGYAVRRGNNDAHPVLPIGPVNLATGANDMFGVVWDGWEEGEGYNILVKDEGGTYRVIHSSGSLSSGAKGFPVGSTMELKHDQTNRRVGSAWTVIGVYPHSREGMAEVKTASNRPALSFFTFK